jgi:threonine/homoserine/homoserine lactone efflux protein
VLCIRRTLAEGWTSGLVSGLGAATADALYGSVAGFGLTFISSVLIREQFWLRLIGGVFLCYLGVKTFRSIPQPQAVPARGFGLARDYGSTFFLTLTNPMTILAFAAVFSGLGVLNPNGSYLSAGILVCGVFAGSSLWWFILSTGVAFLQARFNPQGLRWVNRISGLIIMGFGLLALLGLRLNPNS